MHDLRRLAHLRLELLEDRTVPTVIFAVSAGQGAAPRVKVFNADQSLRFDFMAYDPSFRMRISPKVARS